MEPDRVYTNSGASDMSRLYAGGTSDVSRLVMEREKLHRKLAKVQQRRDHYARLYYRALTELEETKLELSQAKHKIRQLQHTAGDDRISHSETISPDSGTSLSPHHWRPTRLLPQPKPHPAFTRSQTFSQDDSLSVVETPPLFHRQLSLPPSANSTSVSSVSAFQPFNSHTVQQNHPSTKQPIHRGPSTQQPIQCHPSTQTVEALSSHQVQHECLSGLEMLDLLSQISSPHCTITSLEVANSQLGEPQAMRVFCEDLVKNTSITSLSLPENDISSQSLPILLEAVQKCSQLRELLLRNNQIGVDCVKNIKLFLSHTTLDSLVLTGNAIERHSHLLSSELPGEFSMEYSENWDSSGDSGVASTRGQTHKSLECMNV